MTLPQSASSLINRREMLRRAGGGLGILALADLLAHENLLADDATELGPRNSLAPRTGHFVAKAKSVIWLFMDGGPSGFDLFDPKPQLDKHHGEQPPSKIEVFFGNPGPLMKSPFAFKQHGQSGAWVCDKYPTLATCVDDLALVKSVTCESSNHAPALFQMNTGISRVGFPSVGAWVTYGIGTLNQDLPGFVVMSDPGGIKGGPPNWSSGFLPSTYQATALRSGASPILNLNRPADVSRESQRAQLDLLAQLNAQHQAQHPAEADLQARIESYELAYRMQAEAPAAVDLTQESEETRRLYGLDQKASQAFGTRCLLARRLVERGVRFVQAYSDPEWDAHGGLADNHTKRCAETDVPIAGLITDLKRRGLFDSTLVIWGGEFGRMPVTQGGDGRDHNPHGFLMWMAGAGIKGGASHGETDEIGYKAAVDPVTVNDIHATILHLLGVDHKRLTYQHNGRRYRLTDVAGEVLTKILS